MIGLMPDVIPHAGAALALLALCLWAGLLRPVVLGLWRSWRA